MKIIASAISHCQFDFRKLYGFSDIAAVGEAGLSVEDLPVTGCTISLRAQDGHQLDAYEVKSRSRSRGGIVLLQEIFGVTGHIKSVCDGYADKGYHVVAPALFDRIEKGLVLGYSKEDAVKGREWRSRIPWRDTLADAVAAIDHLRPAGKVATIGYCWGGTVSWHCAAHVEPVVAAVCYYPTQIAGFIDERPKCPVLMHFGEDDPIAPVEHARQLRATHDERVRIEIYPAGHGFNCDEIPAFHPPSVTLALRRTLDFLDAHLV